MIFITHRAGPEENWCPIQAFLPTQNLSYHFRIIRPRFELLRESKFTFSTKERVRWMSSSSQTEIEKFFTITSKSPPTGLPMGSLSFNSSSKYLTCPIKVENPFRDISSARHSNKKLKDEVCLQIISSPCPLKSNRSVRLIESLQSSPSWKSISDSFSDSKSSHSHSLPHKKWKS